METVNDECSSPAPTERCGQVTTPVDHEHPAPRKDDLRLLIPLLVTRHRARPTAPHLHHLDNRRGKENRCLEMPHSTHSTAATRQHALGDHLMSRLALPLWRRAVSLGPPFVHWLAGAIPATAVRDGAQFGSRHREPRRNGSVAESKGQRGRFRLSRVDIKVVCTRLADMRQSMTGLDAYTEAELRTAGVVP